MAAERPNVYSSEGQIDRRAPEERYLLLPHRTPNGVPSALIFCVYKHLVPPGLIVDRELPIIVNGPC